VQDAGNVVMLNVKMNTPPHTISAEIKLLIRRFTQIPNHLLEYTVVWLKKSKDLLHCKCYFSD